MANETIYTILRNTRELLQKAYEPLDSLTRFINYKKGYPPLWLRQRVGNLNDFEGSCGEYVAYLKLLCNLQKGDSLLDLGCGCGTILQDTTGQGSLLDYLLSYAGVDVDKKTLTWCSTHYKKRALFVSPTAFYAIPALKSTVDVVLCKSLFTHLSHDAVELYIRDIARVLRPKGSCLCTWFILNDRTPTGRYTFCNYMGPEAYERASKPSLAVAYRESWLLQLFRDCELSCKIYYGTWREPSGGKGLSFQDIVILTKDYTTPERIEKG